MTTKPLFLASILCANLLAQPVTAQSETDAALQEGLGAALHGCSEWVLNPASWASGPQPFMDSVGPPGKLLLVPQVDDAALPPEELRISNHYWRINALPSAGFILVVSDRLPMCHITGGGDTDLQPATEAVVASAEFAKAWELLEQKTQDGVVSSIFRSREEPDFTLVLSRASVPRGRLDRVQLVATAMFQLVQ